MIDEALIRAPADRNTWISRIDTLCHNLLLGEALVSIDAALARMSDDFVLLLRKSDLLRQAGQIVESNRLLSSFDHESGKWTLAQAQTAIALGRAEEADVALRSLWAAQEEPRVPVALALIRALKAQRKLRKARVFAGEAQASVPGALVLRGELFSLDMEFGASEEAAARLVGLTDGQLQNNVMRGFLARKAVADGNHEEAAALHLAAAQEAAVPKGAVIAALGVAGHAGFETALAQSIVRKVRDIVEQKAEILPPVTTAALRLHFAANTGNWRSVYRLSCELERLQPGDLRVTLHRALTAFELARFREAEEAVARVLASDPMNMTAFRLIEALLVLKGEAEELQRLWQARASNPMDVSDGDYQRHFEDLLMLGEHERAVDFLKHGVSDRDGIVRCAYLRCALAAADEGTRVERLPGIRENGVRKLSIDGYRPTPGLRKRRHCTRQRALPGVVCCLGNEPATPRQLRYMAAKDLSSDPPKRPDDA
ncbi:hypothetical protein [Breoghania sp.]|uniref:hypothetical protein n=1 Tax=Breoghania sp. TaxID=2065378 RepID=UPI0026048AD4|nr:hypothetical protein [Breoghania sp.]